MNKNRSFKPFNQSAVPYDPITGKFLSLVSEKDVVALVTVGALKGTWDNAVAYDQLMSDHGIVFKPHILKQTPFDGETVNGITYTYAEDGLSRTATDGVDTETQIITPDYYIGEELLCIRRDSFWQDVNSAGRCWAVEAE